MRRPSAFLPALLRIVLGWTLFWPFLDKIYGLGFSTASGKAWIDGVSPTAGFLAHGVKGPFVPFFHALAGQPIVDWLFMAGLALIGLSLILGVALRVAGICGAVLMALMFLAVSLPPAQNPLVDEHIMYLLLFLWFAVTPTAGDTLGFGRWWKSLPATKRFRWIV